MATANQRAKRNRAIIAAVAKGDKTYDEIAKDFGLTRARVDQLVQHEPGGMEARKQHKLKKVAPKVQVIEEAIENNMTYADIVEKHGRNTNYWRAWAAKLGKADQITSAHEKVVERNDAIIDYLNEGHTQLEAAEKFGIGQSAISGIALAAGRRKRLTGEALRERNAQIVADLESGMSGLEVAQKHDVSAATVYNASRSAIVSDRVPREELQSRNAAILADVDAGMELDEISKKHQVSLYVVRNVANSAKIQTSNERLYGDEKIKRDKQIAKAYTKGTPCNEIAEHFNMSIPSIYAIARKMGATRDLSQTKGRTHSEIVAERNAKIVADYIAGKTYEELADSYHVCIATVYQAIKKSGNIGNGNPRGRKNK